MAKATTVEELLAELDHPFNKEIELLRRTILDADPAIVEEVKWNAPSFRTTEFFATVHLRARDGVQLILHLGAKKRADVGVRGDISDPSGLLTWLANDRATIVFRDAADLTKKRAAFTGVIRDWIRHVE